MRHRLVRPAFVLFLLASLLCIGIVVVGSKLTGPARSDIGAPPLWLGAEEVELTGPRGSAIRGWFVVAHNAKGSVALLHPVRGNRKSMLGRARFLLEGGYSVLLIDLQAHGESDGDKITFGHLESLDAISAVGFLRRERPDQPVFVLGWSLGGAAALLAEPALTVDGFVLESVYPTIDTAVYNRLGIRFGRIGELMSPVFVFVLDVFSDLDSKQLMPVVKAVDTSAPVLIIGGEDDRRTTVDNTKVLYDVFTQRKALWVIPAARHQDFHALTGAEYERRILEFFDSVVAGQTQ